MRATEARRGSRCLASYRFFDGGCENLMLRIAKSVLLPFGAALLLAADPSWKTKDISQWNEQEAKLLLTDSPWVKKATPAALPPQNEASRRQGGQGGGG